MGLLISTKNYYALIEPGLTDQNATNHQKALGGETLVKALQNFVVPFILAAGTAQNSVGNKTIHFPCIDESRTFAWPDLSELKSYGA